KQNTRGYFTMSKAHEAVVTLQEKNHREVPFQKEFLQATDEFLTTIEPFLEEQSEYMDHHLLDLLVEPERIFQFRVPWQDDEGAWRVNRGYRVQFNSAMGPYKG